MPVPTSHANHDATLIAGHAAGDLSGTQLLLVDRLLASCEDCARLHADLRTIAAMTRTLPVPAAATRDFRITRAQADRLRRGGVLRRLLRPFASPSLALRPMAATFSGLGALGLALVLLLPAFGGPAALPAMERADLTAGDAVATAPPPDQVPGGALVAPTAGSEGYGPATAPPGERPTSLNGSEAKGDDKGASTGSPNDGSSGASSGGAPSTVTAAGAPVNPATFVLIASIALLGLGLALFALRSLARRLT